MEFKNLSKKPAIISDENISFVLQSNNKSLPVLNYERLELEIHQYRLSRPRQTLENLKLKRTGVLRKNTVKPSSSVKGVVVIEMDDLIQNQDKNYVMTVKFAGDTHKFYFLRQSYEKIKEKFRKKQNKAEDRLTIKNEFLPNESLPHSSPSKGPLKKHNSP